MHLYFKYFYFQSFIYNLQCTTNVWLPVHASCFPLFLFFPLLFVWQVGANHFSFQRHPDNERLIKALEERVDGDTSIKETNIVESFKVHSVLDSIHVHWLSLKRHYESVSLQFSWTIECSVKNKQTNKKKH